VIADLIFGILPIFVIWDLKMNKKAKMIVGGLLMLGILSVPLPSLLLLLVIQTIWG
jgi:hypothetical protein